MSHKQELINNNTDLQVILDMVNDLPVSSGADGSTVETYINNHNIDTSAHADIRAQIETLTNEKGVENGIATLGADGKILDAQIPSAVPRAELVSYQGSGVAGSSNIYRTIITFSFLPKVVFLAGESGMATFVISESLNTNLSVPAFWPETQSVTAGENKMYQIPMNYKLNDYEENGVTRYSLHVWHNLTGADAAKFQFNASGVTYTAVALG